MNRRQILHGAVAASITSRVDAMHLLVSSSTLGRIAPFAASAPLHLDVAGALRESVATRESLRDVAFPFDVILDLARYATASPTALRLLAPLPVDFADLGLHSLGLATARVLASWRTHFLLFTKLQELTAEEAWALVPSAGDTHALALSQLDSLDIDAARGLVAAAAGNPLYVTLSQVCDDVVCELARHDHELFVDLRWGLLGDTARRMLDDQKYRYRSQFGLATRSRRE
jgi:hypothetical protein